MDWLKPQNIQKTTSNLEQNRERFLRGKDKVAKIVLDAFNSIDPLHVFYDENCDEYFGYVERFMKLLGGRNLNDLKVEQIIELVKNSFYEEQVEKGFVGAEDIKYLALVIANEATF